jgi:hypothetical protein
MSKLRLRIFDGTRQPFALPAQFLVRIVDGNQHQLVWQYYSSNDISFDLPFFDNFGDNYSILVSANGYKQAGYQPVTLSDAYLTTLNIMLIPNTPNFNFAGGLWPAAKDTYPFLAAGANDAKGEQRYNDLLENKPPSLAAIQNLRSDEPDQSRPRYAAHVHQAAHLGWRHSSPWRVCVRTTIMKSSPVGTAEFQSCLNPI